MHVHGFIDGVIGAAGARGGGAMGNHAKTIVGRFHLVGIPIAAALGHGHRAAGSELIEGAIRAVLSLVDALGLPNRQKIALHADGIDGLGGRRAAGGSHLGEVQFVTNEDDQ